MEFFKDRLQNAQRNIAFGWMKLKEFGFAPAVILLLGAVVSAIVSFAAVFGALTIVIGENPPPSATESFGLALLSATLAAVMLLLVKPRPSSADSNSGVNTTSRRPQAAEIVGGFLIVAAMAFALFGLLCPFLGAVSQGQRFFPYTAVGNFSEVCVKWAAFTSLIIGTVTIAAPLTLAPFLFISNILRKKKKTDN